MRQLLRIESMISLIRSPHPSSGGGGAAAQTVAHELFMRRARTALTQPSVPCLTG